MSEITKSVSELQLGPVMSVIICTYNRAAMLPRILESVCNQTLPKSSYEIIVVDNNSKDNTAEVIRQWRSRHPAIRYFFEGKQGLSHARNHGWQMARGSYVAYVDDDCEVPPEWLAVASDIVGRFSPAAFGGPARNMTGPMKPYWFKDNYLFQTDVSEARFLNSDECWKIVGLNMFFRHDLINLIGGFDPRLGMCGERIAYGEESAFLRRVAELEPDRIYFDPRLYVNDLTRPEKLQLGYTLRASFGAGRSSYHMKSYAQLPGRHFQILMEATVKCFSFMVTLARVPIYRDREQYPFIQNFIYEAGADFMRQLGYLYEQHRHFSQNRRRIKHLPDNKRMLSEKS